MELIGVYGPVVTIETKPMISKFWNDDRGGILTTELVLVASTTVAILLSGLNVLRSGIQAEFEHVGNSIASSRVETHATNSNKVVRAEQAENATPTAYVEIFQNRDWNQLD